MQFQLKYYKDPGVIIDAIKVLSLKLNPKFFWSSFSFLTIHNPDDLDYVKTALNSFLTPPKELLLFFYKSTESSINFMTCYIEKILCHDFSNITISGLCQTIEQSATLMHEVFSFYIKNYSPEADSASLLRTDASLPDNLKFYLLSYQLDPKSFSSLLTSWIKKYAALIERDFLKKHSSFQPDPLTMEKLVCYAYPDQNAIFHTRPILYSVCSVLRDFLYLHSSINQNWLITGYRLHEIVDQLTQQNHTIDIQKICEALGDSLRFQVIKYLSEHKYCTRQQMIDDLVLPASSSHHHLEKLKKVGLIESRKHGNSHIYSLNYAILNELADTFKLYAKGGNTL